MLRYLGRRVLGSIPVLLVASFITFWLVRNAVDPLAKYRHQRDSARSSPSSATELGLDQLDHRAVVGLAHALRARRHGHERPHRRLGVER